MRKSDVPTRGIHRLMPYLMLFEPADAEGTDWRCRLVGSAIAERLSAREIKGKTLFELHAPNIAEQRARNYKQVVETLIPNIAKGRIVGTGRDYLEIEVVHLPVRAGDGTVWILGGMFFFN